MPTVQYIRYPTLGGGSGVTVYANIASFPVTANAGSLGVAQDTGILYEYFMGSWVPIAEPGDVLSIGTYDGQSPVSNGLQVVSNALYAQSATTSFPGMVNNTTQSFSGNKTFTGTLSASNLSGTNTGDVTLGTPNGLSLTSQVLSLGLSSASTTGALDSTDWNTFNNKQPAFTSQTANTFYAAPDGSSGVPSFRAIVAADLPSLSATYVTQSEVGANSGVASLDSSGKIPVGQLPSVVMEYQGAWNPNTNTPTLSDGTGTNGYVYYVTALRAAAVSGLTDPSMVNFQIGDLVIYSSSVGKYQLVTPAAGVVSVNTAQGAVTVNAINQLTGDVTAGPASGSQSAVSSLVATSNSTLTTLSALSLPGSQVAGNISGNAANITATSNSTLTTLSALSLPTSQLSGTINLSTQTSGTIDLTTQVSGTLPIANGGTGQISASSAFNALSPMTTGGDLIYGGASGVGTRLANGSSGQVLTSNGGTSAPSWGPPSGFTRMIGSGYITNASGNRWTYSTTTLAQSSAGTSNVPVILFNAGIGTISTSATTFPQFTVTGLVAGTYRVEFGPFSINPSGSFTVGINDGITTYNGGTSLAATTGMVSVWGIFVYASDQTSTTYAIWGADSVATTTVYANLDGVNSTSGLYFYIERID